jgi:hypothetical protein
MDEQNYDLDDLQILFDSTTQGNWEVYHGNKTNDACQIRMEQRTVSGIAQRRTYGYACDNLFICDLNDGEYHQYADLAEEEANARFIATAHNVFSSLLKEIRQLRETTGKGGEMKED